MIFFDHYLERLDSIRAQSDFVRKAIKGFIAQTEPDTEIPKPPSTPMTLADLLGTTDVKQILTRFEFAKGGFPAKYKKLENRLAQNEIILTVAVFEDQMKTIHRELLRQNPKMLNPDREIKLGRLVALREQKVIEHEIEVTVQALDRENVEKRAKAFAKLGLPWGTDIEWVDHMSTLRNRILHEDIEIPVKSWELSRILVTSVTLPLRLYFRAEELYPEGFNSGVSKKEKERTRRIVQKSLKSRKSE